MQYLACAAESPAGNHLLRGYALLRAGDVEWLAAQFEHTLSEENDSRFAWAAKYTDDLENAWEDYDEADRTLPASSDLRMDAKSGKSRVDHAREFWQATPNP